MTTAHRIGIGIASALALGTSAAPALALPNNLNANGSYVPARAATTQASSQPPASASCGDVCSGHGYGSVSSSPTVVRVTTPNSGFDWGDAGIGAAGGIALSMVGLGGALAMSQQRARRTRRTTALSS